ncbi:DUF4169 family protein [Paracoccus sp. Z118]|uniref:DUF4169 family protein n=1 Tax=Paracoccus sp. Z118 TaxID=2851017 RepID=UPI001C2BE26E|nr:DUF4169 family protein [Paracoccus sp. Z118]MBV0891717.1 DUF4169 family protein [Paracoccus sp. Z118]
MSGRDSGKVVNLRQARKSAARNTKRRTGDENAARFGLTRAERAAQADAAAREGRKLDQHRLDRDGDGQDSGGQDG